MKRSEELKQELIQLETQEREFAKGIKEKFGNHWFYGGAAERAYWNGGGKEFADRKRQLEFEIAKELNREIEVGDGVTYRLWSDAYACTVIKKTKKTLLIQRDKATLDPNFKPEWVAGGFAAHCTNNGDQEYTYERNENGEIYRCNWSEKNGRYQSGCDGSIRITRGRHEFYDYNF